MRLLIDSWHRKIIGGAQRYLQGLIPNLIERGHDIGLLYGYHGTGNRPTVDPPDADPPRWCVDDLGTSGVLHAARCAPGRALRAQLRSHLRNWTKVFHFPATPDLRAPDRTHVPGPALSATLRRAEYRQDVHDLCPAVAEKRDAPALSWCGGGEPAHAR